MITTNDGGARPSYPFISTESHVVLTLDVRPLKEVTTTKFTIHQRNEPDPLARTLTGPSGQSVLTQGFTQLA